MKRILAIATLLALCAGCYIPYPTTGRKTLQPYERWDEVCTTKVNKKGEKQRKCRWVRSR